MDPVSVEKDRGRELEFGLWRNLALVQQSLFGKRSEVGVIEVMCDPLEEESWASPGVIIFGKGIIYVPKTTLNKKILRCLRRKFITEFMKSDMLYLRA